MHQRCGDCGQQWQGKRSICPRCGQEFAPTFGVMKQWLDSGQPESTHWICAGCHGAVDQIVDPRAQATEVVPAVKPAVHETRSGWIEAAILAGILGYEIDDCMKQMVQSLADGKMEVALLCAHAALRARWVAIYYGVWPDMLDDIKALPWDQALGLVEAALVDSPGGAG